MMIKAGALIGALVVGASVGISTGVASLRAAPCRMSAFALRLGPGVSEATGEHTLALRLVNRSPFPCLLNGYPTVRFSDSGGMVPFLIRHGGDQMITARHPQAVLVRPGRAAFVVLNHYRCDRGDRRAVKLVRIQFAEGSAQLGLRLTDPYRMPNYCGAGDPGSIMDVSPFVSSLRAGLGG